MTTNYVDIICKYLTWYKNVRVEVEHEEVFGLPILRVYDDLMGNSFTIYKACQITEVFRDLGIWRLCSVGEVHF